MMPDKTTRRFSERSLPLLSDRTAVRDPMAIVRTVRENGDSMPNSAITGDLIEWDWDARRVTGNYWLVHPRCASDVYYLQSLTRPGQRHAAASGHGIFVHESAMPGVTPTEQKPPNRNDNHATDR